MHFFVGVLGCLHYVMNEYSRVEFYGGTSNRSMFETAAAAAASVVEQIEHSLPGAVQSVWVVHY